MQVFVKSPGNLLNDVRTDKPDVTMHLDFVNFESLEVYNQAFVKKEAKNGNKE